jgi:hypothetical protein
VNKDILVVLAYWCKSIVKIQTFEMSVFGEFFEIDYAVVLTFTLNQPNCSVQRDEKHHWQ